MRVLAVILSFLTLFLSSYPCCQEADSCADVFLIGESDEGADESPHENEAPCSPFYACGRCPGFTLNQERVVDIYVIEPEIKTNLVPYLEFVPKEVYFHFLKPPRSFEV